MTVDLFAAAGVELEAPIASHHTFRDPLDRYYTPPELVDVLLDALGPVAWRIETALEPFAGRSLAIASVLAERGVWCHTADIDAAAPVGWHGDSFSRDWTAALPGGVNAVITNPPFLVSHAGEERHASDAIRATRGVARDLAAYLVRLNFLEPCDDRADLVSGVGRPNLLLSLPRVSFTKDGRGDSIPCAWLVWSRHIPGHNFNVVSKLQLREAAGRRVMRDHINNMNCT